MNNTKKDLSNTSPKVLQILQDIENLKALELVALGQAMKQVFNLPDMPTASQGPAQVAQPAAQVEEQTEFNALLKEVSSQANRVEVIKLIRLKTGLGIKESRAQLDLVGNSEVVIGSDISKDEAIKLKEEFAAVGAVIELQ